MCTKSQQEFWVRTPQSVLVMDVRGVGAKGDAERKKGGRKREKRKKENISKVSASGGGDKPCCPLWSSQRNVTHLLLPTDVADNGAGGWAGGRSQDSHHTFGENLAHCGHQREGAEVRIHPNCTRVVFTVQLGHSILPFTQHPLCHSHPQIPLFTLQHCHPACGTLHLHQLLKPHLNSPQNPRIFISDPLLYQPFLSPGHKHKLNFMEDAMHSSNLAPKHQTDLEEFLPSSSQSSVAKQGLHCWFSFVLCCFLPGSS